LEKGEDIDNLVESLERVQKYSAVAGIFPSLHYIITAVLKYDPTAVIPRFSIKRIQQRQELGPPKHTATPNDFLTTFLQLVENKDGPGQFSPEHIVASCGMNVTAGSDTTGISLASVFYYLAKHPESSRKVLDELESTFPDRDHSRCLSFKEAQALPYLQAVIKEALRLHPATGLPLARKVPKVGVSILGKFFHEGVYLPFHLI
jgi:cytochrome P450